MKRRFAAPLMVLLMPAFLSACMNHINDEVDNKQTQPDDIRGSATLKIQTRADKTDAAGSKVSYPVQLYVFGSGGTCAATATIASETDPISFTLPAGTYSVSAVAGADATNYTLPSKEEATKTSSIVLRDGCRHADLMTARNSVVLDEDETNTLTLSLTRQVMQLSEITILKAPKSSTSVKVTFSPLHGGIGLGGTYSGNESNHTIYMEKQADGTTWKSSSTEYLLAPADQATIGVSISYSKGTKSFSYSCGNQLQAGYKLNIKGTYTSKAGVTLTGTMTGATWLGERTIEFSFDDDGTTNGNGGTNGTDTDGSALVDHIPSRGDTHAGCCIFAVTEQTENSATLKLLSSKEISGIIDSGYTTDELQSAIQTNIAQCSMPGIDGWRLPTEDEITTISNNNGYINRMLKEANITPITSGSYFRQMNNGSISAYNITSTIHTGYIDKNTHLRLVATLKVRLR